MQRQHAVLIKTIAVLAAALWLAGAAGCQFINDVTNQLDPPPEPATVAAPPGDKDAPPGELPPPDNPWVTVMIVDEGLVRTVAVESTRARRTPSGRLQVWALLRNLSNVRVQVQARVQFFDQTQAPTEGPTAWRRMFIPPHSQLAYQESSIGIKGIDLYYIEVRRAQ